MREETSAIHDGSLAMMGVETSKRSVCGLKAILMRIVS